MNILLIRNGVVENCIAADSIERAQQFYTQHTCIERTPGLSAGPGFLWDGQTFTEPPAAPQE